MEEQIETISPEMTSLLKKKKEVRISEKPTITLEEAAAYTGIGINRLRSLSNRSDCRFVIYVGSKRMIKRKQFEEFLESNYSI